MRTILSRIASFILYLHLRLVVYLHLTLSSVQRATSRSSDIPTALEKRNAIFSNVKPHLRLLDWPHGCWMGVWRPEACIHIPAVSIGQKLRCQLKAGRIDNSKNVNSTLTAPDEAIASCISVAKCFRRSHFNNLRIHALPVDFICSRARML